MGVDVGHVGRLDTGILQSALDRPGAAATFGVRLGDVVGVVGDPGTEQFGVDRGAAGDRVVVVLDDERTGALAEDEAVATGVPGARRPGGISTLLAAVPEPSSLFAACGLALPLTRRRRR